MTEKEKSGDDKLAQGKYDSAISYYEDAMDIVRISQGILGEKESSSLARKLADAKARRWNPDMVTLYDKSVIELKQLWKEEKFEDYLNFVNKSINKMYELMKQGGNREDLYVKIWKRKYFYDKNITSARAKYLARKWNPEMEEMFAKIEKKSEELWKEAEYADYIDYLKDNLIKLTELRAKGGDKEELITAITTKINQYPNRLKNEEKIIQDRIAVYKDASLVDDSYYEKVEKEQRKEINRFREAQVASLPESFKTKSVLLFPSKKG